MWGTGILEYIAIAMKKDFKRCIKTPLSYFMLMGMPATTSHTLSAKPAIRLFKRLSARKYSVVAES